MNSKINKNKADDYDRLYDTIKAFLKSFDQSDF